jgi:hypothetical protein
MKIVELINNIQLPITNEEADLLDKFDGSTGIPKNELNERQQHVANQLVNKDVLLRRNQDGKIFYKKKNQSQTKPTS